MTRALNQEEINRIVFLRQRGYSLPEIKKITGHSSSTVFKYIQGVKILPEFEEIWKNKRKASITRSIRKWQEAREEARNLIKKLTKKEKILIAASLYWAEGAKNDLSFLNSDPALIKVFLECLKELGLKKERLRVSLRIYEDLNREEALNFWAKIVGISKEKINSISILRGKKKGKLKYGICRIRVAKGGDLLKLLHSLADVIKENLNAPVVQRTEQGTPKPWM
jgi:DNA-binding transcriptional MerR regulator